MPLPPAESRLVTHEVINQPGPPPLANPWATDLPLRAAADAAGADAAALAAFGQALAREEVREAARGAERHRPELRRFDRAGRRIDRVEFHPGYHRILTLGLQAGYAAIPWEARAGGHATHAAMVYLMSGTEPGCCCPMTMTYASAPLLPEAWAAKARARAYDPREVPMAAKAGVTLGMAMTEKQGGSDLRGSSTRAERISEGYILTGHKWFCSAPMSDAFLTLVQAEAGLTCFLTPRLLPDGSLNAIHLLRLKDKLGNRANASAEIEYHGAWAERIGEEGRGIATILDMVHHTRLDTALAPAGLMRAALAEAWHWAAHRTAFQKKLIDQPLMAHLLADLALDLEGTVAMGFRVARAFDAGEGDFARLAVALAKFHANKLAPRVIAEAMEALGGMGYVEETPLPMLFREAPLNGIWEGSGNVIALDILRTLARTKAAEALAAELDRARGASKAYDKGLAAFRVRWKSPPEEAEARAFAEDAALLLAAAALLATAPSAVAEAYAETRLSPRRLIAGACEKFDAAPLLARLGPG